MKFFDKMEQIAIGNICEYKLNKMAYNGCNYFFTTNDCMIIEMDYCKNVVNKYSTVRIYDSICYDYYSHCFYATSKKEITRIYELDLSMKETDCIKLIGDKKYLGVISGISYNYCKDIFIIVIRDYVISVNKNGNMEVLYHFSDSYLTGVSSLCPALFVTLIKRNRQYVYLLDSTRIIYKSEIDCEEMVRNIIFKPDNKKHNILDFDIFVMKDINYPFIIKSAILNPDFTPCKCNYKICKKDYRKHDSFYLEIKESFALAEAKIADILNIGDEKSKETIINANEMNEILCINDDKSNSVSDSNDKKYYLTK